MQPTQPLKNLYLTLKSATKVVVSLFCLAVTSLSPVDAEETPLIERVSIASDGTERISVHTDMPAISADGRYVAFESDGDFTDDEPPSYPNTHTRIFVRDRQTGQTEVVSTTFDGQAPNNQSSYPYLSGDGRYVAFRSHASDIVPNDTNGEVDIFVHDRQTDLSRRVSVGLNGAQSNGESEFNSALSADGRYVVIMSRATNLVNGDTNAASDVFVFDQHTGQMRRVSVSSSGTQGNGDSDTPSISANGRYVTFSSHASNLVSGDNNGKTDAFAYDRQTGQVWRVSVSSSGAQGNDHVQNVSISANGRYVVFSSNASNLVSDDTNGHADIFVRDRQTRRTTRVSVATDGTQGDNFSIHPVISGDGRYVAFESTASTLVAGDTVGCEGVYDPQFSCSYIFIHDRWTQQTVRASVAWDGSEGNSDSWQAAISADGRYVAFSSLASNLVPNDTNDSWDIFVVFIPDLFAAPDRNYFMTNTPELTWGRVSWATGYEIQVHDSENFALPFYERTLPAGDLAHEVATALGNGTWYWRVRALGGEWSVIDRFEVDEP